MTRQPLNGNAADIDVLLSSNYAYMTITTSIVPQLTTAGQYALAFQLGQSAEAIPRLIAQIITDSVRPQATGDCLSQAIAETYEAVVRLTHCGAAGVAQIDRELCELLIALYEGIGRRLFELGEAGQRGSAQDATAPGTRHAGAPASAPIKSRM